MRLKTIKLAGFKSFVDPTVFHLPSNLIGVVGPNGCGKSNIIDAVRWVMGESSARHLRGESMTDVIFNGSNARKPVGTATVELIFDNSDGSVQGEYAGYNEISIKRQVSRDGQSIYFLNGARCRRRDITDIFLGTGLGPRSYSIVEQGMISQIVEAKPEDLRLHLEEAAGISKYKERRRETANRIRHTRENLERLADVRTEVDKRLQHLNRQAKQAERYKVLKAEQRQKQSELLALKWQDLAAEVGEKETTASKLETQLEADIAQLRSLESQLESDRQKQIDDNDKLNGVQKELYQVSGDIARVEQSIQHRKDLKMRQERQHQQTEKNWQELQEHLALDRVQLESLEQYVEEHQPSLDKIQAEAAEKSEQFSVLEERVHAWQQVWSEFSNRSSDHAKAAEVEKTRIDHLDRQLSDFSQRLKNLTEERQQVDTSELEKEINELESERSQARQRQQQQEQQLQLARESITKAVSATRQARESLNEISRKQQQAEGRLSSLQALQQAALGDDSEDLRRWLDQCGLGSAERAAQSLQVENGYETAVESVLQGWLDALVVPGSGLAEVDLQNVPGGQITVIGDDKDASQYPADSLAARVNGPVAVRRLLGKIRFSETREQALHLLESLADDESVITADGQWFGAGWSRINQGEGNTAGVLQRENDIKELNDTLAELSRQLQDSQQALEASETAQQQAEQTREKLQVELNMLHRRVAELDGQIQGKRTRIEHLGQRQQRIEAETSRIRERMQLDQDKVKDARSKLQGSLDHMAELEQERQSLEEQRQLLMQEREQSREAARSAREKAHTQALQMESKRSQLRSTRQSLERMGAQLKQLEGSRRELLAQIESAGQPLQEDEQKLKGLLDQRVAIETRLAEARKQLEQTQLQLRNLEQQRQKADQSVQNSRSKLETARLKLQGVKVQTQGLADQLQEKDQQPEALLKDLEEGADVDQWEAALEKLDRSITRLEPVNLAAIQEFEEEQERKAYLDAQNDDLNQALETLEAAIEKIDRQTRTRFRETFDQVNTGVKTLFPRLFGGGHAYLELTEQDLLTSGVAIMARPPGKRVANIHLLSGGEKALTAVSFVFAIFQLNPAPFCMLDEVDAPLDDANVGRFSEMVKEMSEKVQFVMVTHNKISMEIVHQLSGVTMREPGVSRMVSVDLAEAEKMVAE